jgi:hypothetical protein
MFKYDPKWKDELPYYDIFPLIFPIEIYKDSFLGINLHYLPYKQRAQLMDALYTLLYKKDETISIKNKTDKNDKLIIAYQILKGASKFKNFKPCVKKYLFNHVRSRLSIIPLKHWETVMMLPLARFIKAPESKVWSDSMAKIRGK